MFSAFKPSGLTKENCELLTDYLNNKYNPLPLSKFKWKSEKVCLHDSNFLGISAGSPIVCYEGPNGYRDHNGTFDSLNALTNLIKFTKEYFASVFPKQYYFQDDQYCFYINDRKLLEKLKAEALAFQSTHTLRPT